MPLAYHSSPKSPERRLQGGDLLVAALLVALFLGCGWWQIQQGVLPPSTWHPQDDWTMYHQRALDILRHGLSMPVFPGPYTVPAGFGYIYFLAFIYWLGGGFVCVYLLQSAMLGGAVAMFYFAFRCGLGALGGWLLLILLTLFALLDLQHNYAIKLLSENLFVFELALFCWLAMAGYGGGRGWQRVASLVLLGTLYLTRPNCLPFLLLLAPLLAWRFYFKGGLPWWELLLGLALGFGVVNLMGLRNYVASGHWALISPLTWAQAVDSHMPTPWYWLEHPGEVAASLARRAAFAWGYLPALKPEFRPRPHWMLMWTAYGGFVIIKLVQRRAFSLGERLLNLYVFSMLAPIVLVAFLHGYGYRFLAPVTLPAVAGALLAWPWWSRPAK